MEQITEKLERSLCRCDESCDLMANDLGLCRTLIQLLAQGQPVTARALAAASGRPQKQVVEVIRASRSIELDDLARIVGAGLSLQPTPHRLSLGDRVLYSWCALDALMYPSLLNLESVCLRKATDEVEQHRLAHFGFFWMIYERQHGRSQQAPAPTTVQVVVQELGLTVQETSASRFSLQPCLTLV